MSDQGLESFRLLTRFLQSSLDGVLSRDYLNSLTEKERKPAASSSDQRTGWDRNKLDCAKTGESTYTIWSAKDFFGHVDSGSALLKTFLKVTLLYVLKV